MRSFFTALTFLVVLLSFSAVTALDLRVVVLPKATVDGQPYDAASLETEMSNILTGKNMRIVELDTALKAQKAAFSDLVASGKVPSELSVLNADALVSLQMACDKNSDSIMGSNIKSWFCVVNTKVIRVDSGDVIFSDSKNYTATGLNVLAAINTVVKKNMSKNADASVDQWTKSWSNEGRWNLDLIITGIAQKSKVDGMASILKGAVGVKDAAVVMFKKDFSKITVTGEGSENYAKLHDIIDTSDKLNLRINYEAGRVIHAEFDFGQAYSRGVSAFISVPQSGQKKSMAELISSKGPDILTGYLMNLEYFDIKSSTLLKGTRDSAVAEAKKAEVPLAVFTEVVEKDNEWLSVVELVMVDGNKKLAVVKGTAGDPFEAMDKAVRELDKTYRLSLTKPAFRKSLNLGNDAANAAESLKLTVEKFEVGQIFPSLIPYYRNNGMGSITLKNISDSTLKNVEIAFKMNDKVVGTAKVADIAPKGSAVSTVKIDTIPDGKNEYAQLAANITFTVGETYGRKDAYAPMVVHSKNTIDWSNPMTVASFVDPANKIVRDLATQAVKKSIPGGIVTKQLANASLIYSSLWHTPLKYVSDPVSTSFDSNIDTVQYPAETLSRLAGDCDDLTVLLASLFESVGLATVIITTPGHVFLGVESGSLAGGNVIFNLPASLFVEVDGALFIPVEATAIGSTFAQSWLKAAEIVKKSGKEVNAFRTREAWKNYPVTSVPGEKSGLTIIEPKTDIIQNLLSDVRKSYNEKAPVWAEQIYKSKLETKNPEIKPDTLSKEPLAKSIVYWLTGDRDKAITEAANLCSNGVVESCYNMTVMSMYDALERSDLQTIDANMTKNNYSEAVSMLPANVINMLSDNGGLGMGDEASKSSETKKKIAEILKQARAKTNSKEAKNSSKEIKTSHVGGRKGSEVKTESSVTAEMFFWSRIKN